VRVPPQPATKRPARTGGLRATALSAAATLTLVACGYGVAALPGATVAALPHWGLIAVLGAASLATLVVVCRAGDLLSPLGIVALITLVYFVIRPLQLALSADELLHQSYDVFADPVDAILNLRGQEVSLFVHSRMVGSFDAAMTKAMAALVVLYGAVLWGYRLRFGRLLAVRSSRLFAGIGDLDLRWVVAAWLVVGLGGEAIVFARIGGPGGALAGFSTQGNFAGDFVSLVLLNFYTAALVLWVCFHPPAQRREQVLLVVAAAQLAAFFALLGSRTLVLVPLLLVVLAWNERVRPWRGRTMAIAAVCGLVFASAYLTLREDVRDRPLLAAIANIPHHIVDVRAMLNASPVFDQLLAETNFIPAVAPYRYGGELAQGVLGQVPSIVYPAKPEATDVTFRKLLWGERFLAGRPVGFAGELHRDFGFPGILLGGLLLGILARALTGMRSRAGALPGRELRALVYVVCLMLLYQCLIGSWSLVFGSALAIAIPLVLAVRIFARPA
jgi:hypothetical protein